VGKLLIVCIGGGLGSGARYIVATWAANAFGPDFPRGTTLVNLVGSFLIALVMGLSLGAGAISPNVRLLLTTGILGGFTTYSSFNYETLHFVEEGALGYAGAYVALTMLGCFATGALGLAFARLIVRVASGLAV
jgi:CrcB protein